MKPFVLDMEAIRADAERRFREMQTPANAANSANPEPKLAGLAGVAAPCKSIPAAQSSGADRTGAAQKTGADLAACSPSEREILGVLDWLGPLPLRGLAAAIQIPPGQLIGHVNRLLAAKLLSRRDEFLRVHPRVTAWLDAQPPRESP